MTSRLDDAIACIKCLPDDDQDRAAEALITFASERSDCDLADEPYTSNDHGECRVE